MMKPIFFLGVLTIFFSSFSLNAATRNAAFVEADVIAKESAMIYDSLKLEELGLNEKAFQYAYVGFTTLRNKGKLKNTNIISIADFSQSSCKKRLYIIDLTEMKVIKNTYVAHGRGSGSEFASSFSNIPQSHKSSLGFYITGNTYKGQHGLSLQINGIEKGINDKALARRIVVHGSKYVGEGFLETNPFTGRSFGCPAVPQDETEDIINTIKEGSCLFIYHPSKIYLGKSKILNG